MPEWVDHILDQEKKKRKIPLEIKAIGNNYYLYHSTTKWVKGKHKRQKVSTYLGKITKDGLVERKSLKAIARTVFEYGNARLLHELSAEIIPSLKDAFPDEADELLAMAITQVIRQTPIRLMKTRWEKLYLSQDIHAALSPHSVSETLRRVGMDWAAQKTFFDTLLTSSKYLIYDLSSLFSYSENLTLAEKGHNADHLFLKQVNFALFFAADKKLPVMLKPMPGSVRDIKALKAALAEFDISSSITILDRGFSSNTIPELLREKNVKFIIPLKRNSRLINYTLKKNQSFIYRNRGIHWARTRVRSAFLYVYEDVKLRAEEETTFIEMITDGQRTQTDLERERARFGTIALLSNIKEEGETVYLLLKEREDVELAFDAMKNELENDKIYLSNDDAVRGYFFISFLSLYLYFRVLELLRRHQLIGKISVNELLFELSKIYLVRYDDNRVLLSEVPKKAERFEEMFDIKLFPKSLRS